MENQEATVKLNLAQWNVVFAALGEIPLKNGIEVYGMIRSQVENQVNAPQEHQPAE